MFCLMGIDLNILNHLVRFFPPGAATIGSFILLLLVCVRPPVYEVYKVRQAVYDKTEHGRSRQVQVSQKLSLSTGGNP